MAEPFFIKRGDRAPSYSAILRQGREKPPINLTGTTVRFLMRPKGSTTPKVNATAVVANAANGQVHYDWAATDTDTVGLFEAEWEVTYTDTGRKMTVPGEDYLPIVVREDIA